MEARLGQVFQGFPRPIPQYPPPITKQGLQGGGGVHERAVSQVKTFFNSIGILGLLARDGAIR